MVNILILGITVLFCLVSIVSAQISLPVGVPMPPGAPGSNAVESPAAVAPAGPPAGPPGGGTGRVQVPRVHMPSAGHSRARPSESSVDLGNPSVSVCSGFGWTIYSGNCYKVVEGLMDWNHALAACKAEDPHAALVSIESEAENRFIGRMIARSIARSLQTYHLATTLFNTFWYCNAISMIGLRRVHAGGQYQSTWATGTPATTAQSTTGGRNKYPWGGGQPSGTNKFADPSILSKFVRPLSYSLLFCTAGTKEECVHMFSADGLWNDAGCEIQMTGAICQKPAQF